TPRRRQFLKIHNFLHKIQNPTKITRNSRKLTSTCSPHTQLIELTPPFASSTSAFVSVAVAPHQPSTACIRVPKPKVQIV
ncbi:hypothetical protein, partial [Tychonema sp. LEGE 07203]|uniref:hypothetical protein n=1 Tax=Tychonema sp. LEGE 07203 TaxID=1828671 RepID=UPI001D1499D9